MIDTTRKLRAVASGLHVVLRRVFGGQRGQSMVLFALALPVLLGFVGLALDVGLLYVERENLQGAADSAAPCRFSRST